VIHFHGVAFAFVGNWKLMPLCLGWDCDALWLGLYSYLLIYLLTLFCIFICCSVGLSWRWMECVVPCWHVLGSSVLRNSWPHNTVPQLYRPSSDVRRNAVPRPVVES